jgi:hypothetical protein
VSVQAHSYLDDSLLKEFDSEIRSRHTCLFIRLLLDLGFLISWKKSQILPFQDFLFLGEHYRTDLGLIFPQRTGDVECEGDLEEPHRPENLESPVVERIVER